MNALSLKSMQVFLGQKILIKNYETNDLCQWDLGFFGKITKNRFAFCGFDLKFKIYHKIREIQNWHHYSKPFSLFTYLCVRMITLYI